MIKGGATQETVFRSVMIKLKEGMTIQEAIKAVESTLYATFDDELKARIYQECG